MSNLLNSSLNSSLAALSAQAPRGVLSSIKQASVRTGVDFAYLVQQAAAESSFQPDVKAKTSSASGLFQFIESTWMNMVEKYGPKHGIETQGMSRDELLEMRNDPQKASIMAAEFASENERFLNTHYKGDVGATELYFAHFLGAGNAAAFLNARDENGMKQAALMLPAAANANRNVFYHADGRAKTLDEVYNYFDQKFQLEDKVNREVARDNAVRSYQNPFLNYPDKIEATQSWSNATIQALMQSSGQGSSYGSLLSNPLEVSMLTQMMDLPISDKEGDFQLFSAYKRL